MIREFEGTKEHPENYCHLCGGKNISWYVDNELWNEVTKSEIIPGGICCPLCFVKMAEKKGIKPPAWRLSREGDSSREIELILQTVNQKEQIEGFEVKNKYLKELLAKQNIQLRSAKNKKRRNGLYSQKLIKLLREIKEEPLAAMKIGHVLNENQNLYKM